MLSVPRVVTIKGTFKIAMTKPLNNPSIVPIPQDKRIKNIRGRSGYIWESNDINMPDSAKLDATDKSIALINMTIIWLSAKIIKMDVSVKTSDILLRVTKLGFDIPTVTRITKIIVNKIKSLFLINFKIISYSPLA